jgi:hypothetical protein
MKPATFAQAAQILKLVLDQDPTCDSVDELCRTGLLTDLLQCDPTAVDREQLRQLIGLLPLKPELRVDRRLTIEEMVSLGNYDGQNSQVSSEFFKVTGTGIINVVPELIWFGLEMYSDEAERRLRDMGKVPARIEEILGFGATFPDFQRRFPIVGLDASTRLQYGLATASLSAETDGVKRVLGLRPREDKWPKNARYLAFDRMAHR